MSRTASIIPRLLAVMLVSAGLTGCISGWYRRYGFVSPHDLENKDAVPGLARALEDRNSGVRRQAVIYLSRIGPAARRTIPAIANIAVTDPHPAVRISALEALGRMQADDPRAIDALTRSLKADDHQTKAAALISAGRIGQPAAPALPAIRYLRSHPNPAVRLRAAVTAYTIQPSTERAEAVSVILTLLHSTNARDRQQAMLTVKEYKFAEDSILFVLDSIRKEDRSSRLRRQAAGTRHALLVHRLQKQGGGKLTQVPETAPYIPGDAAAKEPQPGKPVSPAQSDAKIAEKIAVVIGVSEYAEQGRWRLKNLRYAAKDAKAIAAFLEDEQGGGFDRVMVLTDKAATTKNVKIALREKLRGIQENDFVLVFWAGHGTPDPAEPKKLYLVTHDTDPAHLASSGYAMEEFRRDVGKIRARRVLVIADTCHSGGISNPKVGIRGARDNKIVDGIRGIAVVPDTDESTEIVRMIFTSSEAGEISRESEELGGGHGVFSWFLIQALKGAADRDRLAGNRDGIVTLGEVIEYTRDKVKRFTGNQQHPDTAGTFNRNLPLYRIGKK